MKLSRILLPIVAVIALGQTAVAGEQFYNRAGSTKTVSPSTPLPAVEAGHVFQNRNTRVTCTNAAINPKSTVLAAGVYVLSTTANTMTSIHQGLATASASIGFAAVGSGATVVMNAPLWIYVDGLAAGTDTVYCGAGVSTTLWISGDGIN